MAEDCDCPFDYEYTCPACGHARITNHCPPVCVTVITGGADTSTTPDGEAMPEIPAEAIMAAAIAIERELLSGTDYSMAPDSDEALARAALEAAAPILARAVAGKITAHMEKYDTALTAIQRSRWRRQMGIAARIAALAFTTREELLRETAEAITSDIRAVHRVLPGDGET